MSLYDYKQSQQIEARGYPFYALIMAAMRQADTDNLKRLTLMWPKVSREFNDRYNAPGGVLDSDSQASPCQTQG